MARYKYNTRQKQIILNFLQLKSNEHITVQQIEKYLLDKGLPISISTIYRNLEMFVEQGIVKKYEMEGKASACFEYIGEKQGGREDFNFRCKDCGKLKHFKSKELQGVKSSFKNHTSVRIDLEQTVFLGICDECFQKNNEKVKANEDKF